MADPTAPLTQDDLDELKQRNQMRAGLAAKGQKPDPSAAFSMAAQANAAGQHPVPTDDLALGQHPPGSIPHPAAPAAPPPAPVASGAAAGWQPMGAPPAIAKPTTQQSIATGAAEHATTPDAEAVAQFGKGKAAYNAERPEITAKPGTEAYGVEKQAQMDFDKAHPLGGDVSKTPGTWGKIEHVLGRVGNIAGDVLAPGEMSLIPGTDLNNARKANANANWIKLGAENDEKAAQTNAMKENAERVTWTAPNGQQFQVPRSEWAKLETQGVKTEGSEQNAATNAASRTAVQQLKGQQAATAMAGKTPTTEQDKVWAQNANEQLSQGNLGIADRQRLAGIQRYEKLAGLPPEIAAQVGPPPVPADFPKGTNDPGYLKSMQAWGASAEAGKTREGVAIAGARGAAANATRPVQVLDEDGFMRYETAGQAIKEGDAGASEGTKAASRQAQVNDIKSASKHVRDILNNPGADVNFSSDQVAKLSLVMNEKDPTVFANEMRNYAASIASPQQRQLVTWLGQLQERALSLRNIAGMGQGSESTRMAILNTLPSITSGNRSMALTQLDAFDNMVSNLEGGMAKVHKRGDGGPAAAGGNSPAGGGSDKKVMTPAEYIAAQNKGG